MRLFSRRSKSTRDCRQSLPGNSTAGLQSNRRSNIEGLEERRLLSVNPQLIRDINLGTLGEAFTEFNGHVYFPNSDATHGSELWRSDGTIAGTSMFVDLIPGTSDSDIGEMAAASDKLFFAADNPNGDSLTSQQVWITDGTTQGTEIVSNIVGYSGFPPNPRNFVVVGNDLFFTAASVDHGEELWYSDGTLSGTMLVKDLSPGINEFTDDPDSTRFHEMVALGDQLIFLAGGRNELYRSDGTELGTSLIFSGRQIRELTVFGGNVFFAAESGSDGIELWRTDGYATGTVQVANIHPGDGNESLIGSLTTVGNTLYFHANDGIHGTELWKNDGTSLGTQLVADITAGPVSSTPDQFTNLNGTLYFAGDDGIHGRELWKSDGTAAGTVMVGDFNVGPVGSNPSDLMEIAGMLFFTADAGSAGRELWASDGTEAGTHLVKDIYVGNTGSSPELLTALGNQVVFSGFSAQTSGKLFISDGTTVGTQELTDLQIDENASKPYGFSTIDGITYFDAKGGTHAAGLYRTDGTEEGTVLVSGILPGEVGSGISYLTVAGDKVFFAATDGVTGGELWVSDGTIAGTIQLADIEPGAESSAIRSIISYQDSVFLRLPNDTVWRSDGTVAGTFQFPVPGNVDRYASNDNLLFFAESNGPTWISDGTVAGTHQLFDVGGNPVLDASFVDIHAMGSNTHDRDVLPTLSSGVTFFTAETTSAGQELWRSDGTQAGTFMVKDINPGSNGGWPKDYAIVDDILYFVANEGQGHGDELMRTDGTFSGTFKVTPNLHVPARNLAAVGDQLFFRNYSPEHGHELWTSDGTEAGTRLVKDIRPGSGSSNPRYLTEVDGLLYFQANDNTSGEEIWVSDGTEEGTLLLVDLYPGYPGSEGENIQLFAHKNALIFAATDGTSGEEPWLINVGSNQAPQADAGGPYTVPVGGSVLLDASASFDPDLDEALSYFWDVNGDGDYRDAAGKTVTLDWAALNALGISEANPLTQVSVRVSDGIGGAANSAAVSLAVVTESADIGGPYTGDEGSLIALTGAASVGATLYEWDFDNDGQFDDATGENVNFNATDNGVFTIGLRMNGAGGPTDSTTVTVNNVAPTASISGTTDIYRGETVTFTLNAVDASPVDQAGLFDFEIDWDGNGSVDQTVLGVVSGTTVQHTFPTTFTGNIQVRATDKDAATGSFAQTPITVTDYVLRDDGLGATDLIWGGTPSLDAVFFLGTPVTLAMFVQFENLTPVNRIEILGSSVTGKIIVHGYGGNDVIVGELVSDLPLEAHGGDGDDVIVGGMWGDELYGDGGNDVILGGTQIYDSFDFISGGEGRDTLFGHLGADILDGGGGEDLLIGDQLSFSDVPQAVLQIGEEWKSARPFGERISNILGITSTGINNGTSILSPGISIIDDGEEDTLIGGLGDLDWFFYDFDQDFLGDTIEIGEEETDSDP